MAFGMEAVAAGTDCLGIGEMGIGNTTVAAALYAALFGGDPAHWVGHGTGVDREGLSRKVAAVEAALAHHAGHLDDPLQVLARLGGREIAAMAGAILAARLQRIPVVIDGYVATAAAAVLHAADPSALDHCLAGHVSAEGVHAEVLERLGLVPLLALGMRLGEASGAGMAMGLLKGALACHTGMATFAQGGCPGSRRRPPVDPPRRHRHRESPGFQRTSPLAGAGQSPAKQVFSPERGRRPVCRGFTPTPHQRDLVPLESPIRRSSRCSRRTARAP